jgi:hypothetical protein
VNSGGRLWLKGGPEAPEVGDGEGRLHFGGKGAQVALTIEGGWRRHLGKIPAKVMAPTVGGMDKWCWVTEEEAMACLGSDERAWRRVVA